MRQEGRSPCCGGHLGLALEQRPEGMGRASSLSLTGHPEARGGVAGGGWKGGLEPSFGVLNASGACVGLPQCAQCLLRGWTLLGLSPEAPLKVDVRVPTLQMEKPSQSPWSSPASQSW